MQPGDGVVQLITMPAVPPSDSKLQDALKHHHDEDRPGRERNDGFHCRARGHAPSLDLSDAPLAAVPYPDFATQSGETVAWASVPE